MSVLRTAWGITPEKIRASMRGILLRTLWAIHGRSLRVKIGRSCFRARFDSFSQYRAIREFCVFEPEFLEEFIAWASKASVVYDVGAYNGLYSLCAACCNPEGLVFAFEPEPCNYLATLQNVALNGFGRIRVCQLAVGDVRGVVPLVVPGKAGGGSTTSVSRDARCEGAVTASVSTLDALLGEESFPPPGLIKVDVEGYEAHVLRGARELLQHHQPVVLVEMHPKFLEARGESVGGVETFMDDLGYERKLLRAPGVGRRTRHKQTHVAFVPKSAKMRDG